MRKLRTEPSRLPEPVNQVTWGDDPTVPVARDDQAREVADPVVQADRRWWQADPSGGGPAAEPVVVVADQAVVVDLVGWPTWWAGGPRWRTWRPAERPMSTRSYRRHATQRHRR